MEQSDDRALYADHFLPLNTPVTVPTSEEVADVIVKAATAARPKSRYAVTRLAKLTMLSLRLFPRSVLDKAFKRQFRIPDRM